MKVTAVLVACAGFLLLHVPAASAEDFDPALSYNGSGCTGTSWCASTNLNATDPISGDTGLVEYILKTAAQGGSDPSVVTGDVDMSDGYVLRFEMSGGTPEIFIINNSNHLLAAYDTSSSPAAGANPLSETSAPDGQQAVWKPANATVVGYDTANSPPPSQTYGFTVVPEPASIILLGAGLGLIGLGARRRMRRN